MQAPARQVDNILIRCDPVLHKKIKRLAKKNDTSMNKMIERVLNESFDNPDQTGLVGQLCDAFEKTHGVSLDRNSKRAKKNAKKETTG